MLHSINDKSCGYIKVDRRHSTKSDPMGSAIVDSNEIPKRLAVHPLYTLSVPAGIAINVSFHSSITAGYMLSQGGDVLDFRLAVLRYCGGRQS